MKLFVKQPPPLTLSDWLIRTSVSLLFLVYGLEKFSNQPGTQWVKLFAEIGWGVWFRYLAGVVEIAGALLVLIPHLVMFGFAVLGTTMGVATFVVAFVLHKPAQSLFPGAFFVGVCVTALIVNGKTSENESLSLRHNSD
jgi:uncharacterized membrane protein YphA (DoxX/SURF4 family)